MLTLEDIENAILQLRPEEFFQLKEWLDELDQQLWDEQLEKDVAEGKLEFLAQEALADWGAEVPSAL